MERAQERTATFLWHGPFALTGKPGQPPEKRLTELGATFPGDLAGLYVLVGKLRHGLIRQDGILYIGEAGVSFRQRFHQLLDPARGDDAKILEIERRGSLSAVWLATLASCPAHIRHGESEPAESEGASELDAYRNALIHLILRHDPRAARHFNTRERDFNTPPLSCVMINRFDMSRWDVPKRPKWRPTAIPDVIDCQVVPGPDGPTSVTQLIWTGTRGVRLHRKACRPAGLYKAAVSTPRRSSVPSL